jgi:hypothetical protein
MFMDKMLILRGKESPMSLRFAFGVAVAATLAAIPVSAHETAEVSVGADAAAALTQAVAGEPGKRLTLARLRSPLCLAVAAQDDAFARTVAKRIMANARAAGVPTRRAGCSVNALVSFSDDARAQMQAVREDGRKLFRRMSEKEIDAALASRDPAYVFQATELTPRIGEGDSSVGLHGLSSAWTKESAYPRTPRDLLTTMVVFDQGAVEGMDPIQLADYATLRLLAPTGEVDANPVSAPQTILALFAAPEAAPAELSRSDRAYLRALYNLPRTAVAAEVIEEAVKVAAK